MRGGGVCYIVIFVLNVFILKPNFSAVNLKFPLYFILAISLIPFAFGTKIEFS